MNFLSQKLNEIFWLVIAGAGLISVLCQWHHFLETKAGAAEENAAVK